jgi:hypothetical protein
MVEAQLRRSIAYYCPAFLGCLCPLQTSLKGVNLHLGCEDPQGVPEAEKPKGQNKLNILEVPDTKQDENGE